MHIHDEQTVSSFEGARFAAMTDLRTSRWRECFEDLRRFSNDYLAAAQDANVWPSDYSWPIDALHTNTRVWEYPFVWDAMQRLGPPVGTVLDIGSALTFFPLFLASRGTLRVIASDLDPYMVDKSAALWQGLQQHGFWDWPADRIEYARQDVTDLTLAADSIDIVTNISVLEHLPIEQLHRAATSILRVLKPGGLLVCTLDCWVRGARTKEHHPLNAQEFHQFMSALIQEFEPAEEAQVRLPSDVITNFNVPRDIVETSSFIKKNTRRKRLLKRLRRVCRAVLDRPEPQALEWCAFGTTLRKGS